MSYRYFSGAFGAVNVNSLSLLVLTMNHKPLAFLVMFREYSIVTGQDIRNLLIFEIIDIHKFDLWAIDGVERGLLDLLFLLLIDLGKAPQREAPFAFRETY